MWLCLFDIQRVALQSWVIQGHLKMERAPHRRPLECSENEYQNQYAVQFRDMNK